MRRRRTAGLASTLLVALGIVGCGSEGANSPRLASASSGSTPSPRPAPPSTPLACPDSPQTLPSPLPALGDTLKVPGALCSARYEGIADVRGQSTFTLTIGTTDGKLYFAPTLLKGTAGQSLTLHIVDTTHHLHNISIPEQSINRDIPVDGAIDVVVTFPAAGPLVYFCSYHDVESQAGELLTVST